MNKLQKLAYILSWIPALAVKFVLWVIGLFVIPFALLFGSQEKFEKEGRFFPKVFFLWDNKEEGLPDYWIRAAENKHIVAKTFPKWWWFANRNPVNGMRYIFKDREATYVGWPGEPMEANDLIEAGVTEASRWAYNGAFAGYRTVKLEGNDEYSEFWIGWKVGSRVPGMGLTLQRRKNRKIGT